MKNSKNKRTMVLMAILFGLLVVGYKVMFVSPEDPMMESTDSGLATGEKIAGMLQRIERIDFDTTIISDPKFKSLKSIEIPLLSLPIGKSNPFAKSFSSN